MVQVQSAIDGAVHYTLRDRSIHDVPPHPIQEHQWYERLLTHVHRAGFEVEVEGGRTIYLGGKLPQSKPLQPKVTLDLYGVSLLVPKDHIQGRNWEAFAAELEKIVQK